VDSGKSFLAMTIYIDPHHCTHGKKVYFTAKCWYSCRSRHKKDVFLQ
jgi:hypothetical protein